MDFDAEPSPFKFPAFQAGPRTCLGEEDGHGWQLHDDGITWHVTSRHVM